MKKKQLTKKESSKKEPSLIEKLLCAELKFFAHRFVQGTNDCRYRSQITLLKISIESAKKRNQDVDVKNFEKQILELNEQQESFILEGKNLEKEIENLKLELNDIKGNGLG